MKYINAATGERVGEINAEFYVVGRTEAVVPSTITVDTRSFSAADVKAVAQEDKEKARAIRAHRDDWTSYYA